MADVSGFAMPSALDSFTPGAVPRYRYWAFGGVFESEIELPELSTTARPDAPRCRLVVEESAPPAAGWRTLGTRQVGPESYTLSQLADGFRLDVLRAGVFEIRDNGSRIVWYRRADAFPELVRTIALGPAMALALELAGFLCLHASAVMIGDEGVVFVGPKHHGKSTLATALTVAGGRLIGDDLVAATSGPPPCILPGVASVRLWEDVVDALALSEICRQLIGGVKTTAAGFPEGALVIDPCPLSAVYVLDPVTADSEHACSRARLPFGAAAIRLAQQTKLPDALVGMRSAASQLAHAGSLAVSVPVWTLSVARDLARLPAIVEQLFSWHGESVS